MTLVSRPLRLGSRHLRLWVRANHWFYQQLVSKHGTYGLLVTSERAPDDTRPTRSLLLPDPNQRYTYPFAVSPVVLFR
jgi:hypothetical protein